MIALNMNTQVTKQSLQAKPTLTQTIMRPRYLRFLLYLGALCSGVVGALLPSASADEVKEVLRDWAALAASEVVPEVFKAGVHGVGV